MTGLYRFLVIARFNLALPCFGIVGKMCPKSIDKSCVSSAGAFWCKSFAHESIREMTFSEEGCSL